jgi:hypothetical protein
MVNPRRRLGALVVILFSVAVLLLAAAAPVAAHHEFTDDGTKQDNKHALHDFSHGGEGEHIASNVNYGLEPLGNLAPAGIQDGRYTDVWSERHYAYLGSFEDPTCDRTGVFIMDIEDPSNPTLVRHIKSPPNTRVNDVKTVQIGSRTVLIHTLEQCGFVLPGGGNNPPQLGQGGISLWDVTDPAQPKALKSRFLNFGVHNTFPWQVGGKTYLILVDDEHAIDVHIADISKPQSPKLISSTGLPDWPAAQDDQSAGMGNFAASFNHDVWVAEVGSEYHAVVSYWDAGWVSLNVTDPANPAFIDDSAYPDPDPISGISPPEGNAHAGVFSADTDQIYAGDEDFDPYRILAEITSGPFAGEIFNGNQGSDVPLIDQDTSLTGQSFFVGTACGSAPSPPPGVDDAIAVIERGGCAFTDKAQTVEGLGYIGAITFNSEDGDPPCEGGVSPLVEAGIPFLFVARSVGFQILGIEGYNPDNCPGGANPSLPAPGTQGSDLDIRADFDGWAYYHLLDRASLQEEGYYAPGELFDEDYASGFGDLSMHNVEGDPDLDDGDRAYIAWYSAGMRVIENNTGDSVTPPGGDWDAATPPVDDYYGENVTEVGRFIAEDGSNFWGVHVHKTSSGDELVLASDRNSGLWIFTYNPEFCQAAQGFSCP